MLGPVKTGHSESPNIEFNNLYDLNNIKRILRKAPGCKVIDDHKDGGYVTPLDVEGVSYNIYFKSKKR